MKRRSFLKTSVVGSVLAGMGSVAGVAQSSWSSSAQQILEWRRFVTKSADKRDFVTGFLQNAAVPALNRLGVKPVGVFHAMPSDAATDHSVYVLTAYKTVADYAAMPMRLGQDSAFMDGAYDYLNTDKDNPAYERIENGLFRAFAAYPTVKAPRSNPERIFELRIYESHNEYKGMLKVEMFNTAELDIFAKVGLDGVFYGQGMVGANLPQLTYMLAFRDMKEREEIWAKFGSHPDWIALRGQERYRDTVSKIHQHFLVPAPGSQI